MNRIGHTAILALAAFVLMTSGAGRALHAAVEHAPAQAAPGHAQCDLAHGEPAGESSQVPDTDEDCSHCDLLHAGAKALPAPAACAMVDLPRVGHAAASAARVAVRAGPAAHPARGPPAALWF